MYRKEVNMIDEEYFSVLFIDEYDITIKSNNTKHVWNLHCVDNSGNIEVILFHKHHLSDQYHLQMKCKSVPHAIKVIKAHDLFQLNGRKNCCK